MSSATKLHVARPSQVDPSPIPLSPEKDLLLTISQMVFRSIPGGYQVKTVYLSSDLALYVPKLRDPIFWDEPTIEGVMRNPLLRPFYLWSRKRNSALMFQMKQVTKYFVALLKGDPEAEPRALMHTLESYRRAETLGELVDPFVVLRAVTIKTDRGRQKKLAWVIVRERCDRNLLQEVRDLVLRDDFETARLLLEEMLALDEEIWRRQLCNIDCSLKNVRLREGQVVLRDAGQIVDNHQTAMAFIEGILWDALKKKKMLCPVNRNFHRLRDMDEQLALFYLDRSREVYNLDNLARHWLVGGKTAVGSRGSRRIAYPLGGTPPTEP